MRGRRFVLAAALALLGVLSLCLAPPAGAQTITEYFIDHYAGQPEGGALGEKINAATGLVRATDGTLYVTDSGNDRVLKVTPAGVVSRVAGTGEEGRGADGVPATSSELNFPAGLALDHAENLLYIAVGSNHRVRKVDLRTGIITTVAGTGTRGFSGDGGAATAAQLQFPADVAVARDGTLYIADGSNRRVRKVAPDGTITTVAGTGTRGFSGDGGAATAAQLQFPRALALNPAGTTLYVADSSDHRIRAIDLTANPPTISTAFGDGQTSTLNSPWGVAVDSSDTLYIPARNGHRVYKRTAGGIVTTFAGTGTAGFSGDGGPADQAQLNQPRGIGVYRGAVYIVDSTNHRVRAIGADGIIRTVLGTGTAGRGRGGGYGGDNGHAHRAVFNQPRKLAVARDGTMYVADYGNHRIRKITPAGIVTTIAGTGAECTTAAEPCGDGGLATEALIDSPSDIALSPDERTLYIAARGDPNVRAVNLATGIITTFAGTWTSGYRSTDDGGPATSAQLYPADALAVGPDGTLYIAGGGGLLDRGTASYRVRAVAPSGTITTIAGGGTTSIRSTTGDRDPLGFVITMITTLAVGPDNTLYLGGEDTAYSSTTYIMKITPDRTRLTSLFPDTPANSLALSRDGRSLYAVDAHPHATSAGHVVHKIDLTARPPTLQLIAGVAGSEGNSGDGGLALRSRLSGPRGLAVGPDGRVYVADTLNARIRVLRRVTLTVGGTGTGDTTDDGPDRRRQPTDHHGNTPATATVLAPRPTTRTTGFLHYGDQDYFRLTLPHPGLLLVETSGWTNTVCTAWQDDVELGSAELGGRLYNCRLGVPVQAGPVTIRVTEASKHSFGSYGLRTRFIAGQLDPPLADTTHTGLGVLTGWVCSAAAVELEIDGQPYQPAPMPAPTPGPPSGVVGVGGAPAPPPAVDPHELCGDTATGFGLPVNWNLLGDGDHTLVARLYDYAFARATVQVTTLGEEFVRDAAGECVVPDFPLPAHRVGLVWQEAGQHFALTDGSARPPAPAPVSSAVLGHLETPAPASFQSGWGSISGWVCAAEEVVVEIDGEPYAVAYGTERTDTAGVCGEEETASGFGLRLNWTELGPGDHEVVALADGVVFGRATVRVHTLGGAFMRGAERAFVQGLAGECVVDDFPAPGETVTVEWQAATQNFVITAVE